MKVKSIDFTRESPYVVLIFRYVKEAGHFEIADFSDAAFDFFGFDRSRKDYSFPNLLDFWDEYFAKEDVGDLFTMAGYLEKHPQEDVTFTCRARNKDHTYRYVAGFVKAKEINGTLYAFAFFFEIQDLELLDQQFWSHSLPAHLVLEDVLETVAYPIYWVGSQGHYLGCNQAFLRFFGLHSKNEVLGKSIYQISILSKESADQMVAESKEVLQKRKAVSGERRLVLKKEDVIISYVKTPMVKDNKAVGVVCSFTDITQGKQLQNRLKDMADMDFLTDLPNRRSFLYRTEEAKKNKEPYAIFMLDLDSFKEVNDEYGHEEGDKVLYEVSRALEKAIKEEGYIARYGGDEFIILSPEQEQKKLDELKRRIEDAILSLPHKELSSHHHLSISVGYALSKEAPDTEGTIALADQRMYLEKKAKKLR